MMAAKLLVSRCFPLVTGGNCDIFTRKSSDFLIAGARFLVVVSQSSTRYNDGDVRDIASHQVIVALHRHSKFFLMIIE